MLQAITNDNTRYLREIALEVLVMTGNFYTERQVARALASHGFTRKIADVRAMERDPIARTEFAEVLNSFPIETFVSIDESKFHFDSSSI
eukprot:SAG31_NODE_187_length_20848_cov_22.521953_1_plen_90_part_00